MPLNKFNTCQLQSPSFINRSPAKFLGIVWYRVYRVGKPRSWHAGNSGHMALLFLGVKGRFCEFIMLSVKNSSCLWWTLTRSPLFWENLVIARWVLGVPMSIAGDRLPNSGTQALPKSSPTAYTPKFPKFSKNMQQCTLQGTTHNECMICPHGDECFWMELHHTDARWRSQCRGSHPMMQECVLNSISTKPYMTR